MCSPFNSSKVYDKWQSNLDNKFVQESLLQQPTLLKDITLIYQSQRGYQHLKDILSHPLRHLKVLGGEPTLDKELFRILQQVPVTKKSKIHVLLVTNGSQDLVAAADKLQGYRSVSFTVSLEGIGQIQDYVRNGSNWTEIEQNILNAKKHGLLVDINCTVQAMNVLNLHELLSWCHDNQISIALSLLNYPNYLAVSVLPDNIQKMIIDNLTKIQNVNVINSLTNTNLLSVNNIINLIKELPRNPEKYTKFLEYVEWFDQDSAQKLQDIQPAFYTR
jgi:sulfatase maturation enzyme AslB (radical SAM superfamily)